MLCRRFRRDDHADVRVGPNVVTDPAFIVTRCGGTHDAHADTHSPMEDFVTWVDTSKIRRHVAKYNDKVPHCCPR